MSNWQRMVAEARVCNGTSWYSPHRCQRQRSLGPVATMACTLVNLRGEKGEKPAEKIP